MARHEPCQMPSVSMPEAMRIFGELVECYFRVEYANPNKTD